MPAGAVDFLHAGCKQGSTTTNRFILKIYILHLQGPALLFPLSSPSAKIELAATRWGDISMLGALKFALSEFSWWEQGLQAACFDSLPAANGREKVGASGQVGPAGLDCQAK